jgi:HD-like signal output (HDOD) protein
MARLSITERLDTIEDLPTLPIVVTQLQKLIANPRSNMSQIAGVIARDQAIAGRVIRLVNSAFYGLRNRVVSIQQAIVVLGLNTVKNLVVGVSVVKTFGDSDTPSLFDRERLWLHAFGCAYGAKLIAGRLRRDEPEDYFLAGLLHDTGILILDQFVHDRFVEVLRRAVSDGVPYLRAEEEVLGGTHQEVGEYVGARWKLPDGLLHAMRCHHHPVESEADNAHTYDLAAVVHAADVVADNAGVHMGVHGECRRCDESVPAYLGLRPSALEEIAEQVREESRGLMKEWGL